MATARYLLCTGDPEMAAVWRKAFAEIETFEVIVGNIFSVACDALVSPANGLGIMDGGIDREINAFFHFRMQEKVQKMISDEYQEKLQMEGMPVGHARVLETGDGRIPYLVVAPTMSYSGALADQYTELANPLRAFKAVCSAVERFNRTHEKSILRVAVPAMGEGVGQIAKEEVAKLMRRGWDRFEKERREPALHG